ncbi:glycoside hydrolase family 31 protein [Levilactobacillus sp. HBUAS70063]|uniref:glycoside hydrolase family 31 protein n=1 Tax=Levilactobacillus sp. HBUAS70063 TaxID=3109359 RepID=UPI003132FF8A
MIVAEDNKLVYENEGEHLEIIPWGTDGFRVRSTRFPMLSTESNALSMDVSHKATQCLVEGSRGEITNGKIKAAINGRGKITLYNQNGAIVLDEYQRSRNATMKKGVDKDRTTRFNSALKIEPRMFTGIAGGDFKLTLRFESDPDEKIFGMGQYQQDNLNLKGTELELAQRNSQASVPFMISNLGYGFLWNNPAIGRVSFGKNITTWEAEATKELDYWITVGDTPQEIERHYGEVSGTVPEAPDYSLGFWQSRLRYRTQEELLKAAHEYKRRHLPIDVIVIDYFHWPKSGEFRFDSKYWPDPEAMCKELEKMGIKLMVSIWPTVDNTATTFDELNERGLLVRADRGPQIMMDFLGNNGFVDFTNPKAQKYVWNLVKQNYYDKGVTLFWLDEAEPEYRAYDFDNYRYYEGSALEVANKYPVGFSKAFYDGMYAQGVKNPMNLVRCAWAGSQKYGALVWSGDVDSSFKSLRNQLAAGLSMGIAGIPWWTTDIGGFHGGVDTDPEFQELVTRWFEFATFCPVMRMHGDRDPHTEPLGDGGGRQPSGAETEIWAYGDKAYDIMRRHLSIREALKPYLRKQMDTAHKSGDPVMRPLFFDFPDDNVWDITDEYMFGTDILVAPVLYAKLEKRQVYLPGNSDINWIDVYTGEKYSGGTTIETELKLDHLPVFIRSEELLEAFKPYHKAND